MRSATANQGSRKYLGALLALGVGLAALALTPSAGAVSDSTAVSLGGSPLTVYVGPRGQCQSSYIVNGKVAGNFYPGGEPFAFSPVGDCGFFLAFPKSGIGQPALLGGKTFGFEGHAGPLALTGTYTPVGQSAVTGDGSSGNPYTQTTTFTVVDSEAKEDASITETTTYFNGAPQFTSTYTVKNTSSGKLHFRAIYVGDLFVNGDDHGVGVLLGGPPRFIGGQNTSSGVLGGLQETSSAALPWSSFEELAYPDVWNRIGASDEEEQAFHEGLQANEVDNAVGVEWDQLRANPGLAPGAEQAFSVINRTQVPSALGVQPAAQTHTVGQTATVSVAANDTAGAPYANRPLVYRIEGANPKSGSVTTSSSGVATISYVGTAAGLDTVQMFLDLAATGSQKPQDPASAARITWASAPPTPPIANSGFRLQSLRAGANGTLTIVLVPVQDGRASVEVTVPTATISRNDAIAAKKRRCKRTQTLIKGKCRPKTTVSGKVSAIGKAATALKLTVKPSSKIKRALAKGKTVRLTVKLTYKSRLGGKATAKVLHLNVKGRSKRKRHG